MRWLITLRQAEQSVLGGRKSGAYRVVWQVKKLVPPGQSSCEVGACENQEQRGPLAYGGARVTSSIICTFNLHLYYILMSF